MNGPFTPGPGEREFDDPRLEAALKSLTARTAPPADLVARVERMARVPARPRAANPWAERLPALASLGLLLSMLIGACSNLPVGTAMSGLMGGHPGEATGSRLMLAGIIPLVIGSLATIGWLCGAPLLRRFDR
jgi:hypothetical protein